MKTYISKGTICIPGDFNLIYRVCDIFYYLNSDDTFQYVFKPNYSVIELINSKYFQGVPGINLDLKKEEYIRENITPTFISERVPSKKRLDYFELLQKVGMEYMDPIEYLIKTDEQYFGDKLFVIPYENKKIIHINKDTHDTNFSLLKIILLNICLGNDIIINNQKIDDENRKIFHDVFIDLYSRSYELRKEKQKEGIAKAKSDNKYKGRKPIKVNEVKFLEKLSLVNKKEISTKEAAASLGISIDKFYRLKKTMQN